MGLLVFLFVSPIFGGHVHHACLEGVHGFEWHSNKTVNDKFHGKECQSESLFQHTFEQGAAYSRFDSGLTPTWNLDSLSIYLAYFQDIYLKVNYTVSYLELDYDVGLEQKQINSALLRAPPAPLS